MRVRFGKCELDFERRELWRDGALVHTRAKVFDVLRYMVENRDRVLSRNELLEQGWPGLTVSDATLSSCILEIRRAIGDDGAQPQIIKTLRGQGFRFVADVNTQDAASPGPGDPTASPTESEYRGHVRDEGLAIAVLPFARHNDDPHLSQLAGGLAEDITTALSRFKAFIVVAHGSGSESRPPVEDFERIGAELRVDYILEGSVRSEGETARAAVQLIHAPTTTYLWAEKYDGPTGRLLALQDEITQAVATRIKPEVDQAEMRRAAAGVPECPSAQDMAWRGRALIDRARLEADAQLYNEGITLAEAAAEKNPRCRQAWWTICMAYHNVAFSRRRADPSKALSRAWDAAEKLRTLDRNDHSAYLSFGWISFIERNFERALTNMDQAYELNPNCTMTLMQRAAVLTSAGDPESAYEHLTRAIRSSPRDTWLGFMYAAKGFACYPLGRYEEGAAAIYQAIEREPHAPANNVILAACLAEMGDLDGAAAAVLSQCRISENYLTEYLEGKRLPFRDTTVAARYVTALKRAATAAGL